VHVDAAFTELEFDTVWIGAGNREDLTYLRSWLAPSPARWRSQSSGWSAT
jgi:hypothetical protein